MIETIPKHLLPVRDPGLFEPGRRCEHESDGVRCITTLSRNNPGPNCELHTEKPDPPAVARARFELERLAMEEAA